MKQQGNDRIKLVLFGLVAAIVLSDGLSAHADFTFGTPTNLGPIVNTSSGDSVTCFSSDGLEMYLDSNRSGEYGGWDIWVAKRPTKDDHWGTPVNLGPTVNSSSMDGFSHISADGLSLFFESKRPGGVGGGDIWVARRTGISESWSSPVNLGPVVNSPSHECGPVISPDGFMLYFSSERPGGLGGAYGDIYEAAIIPIVDFNGDGIVDTGDMCIMVDHWGEDYSLCDIGPMAWGDGIVDVEDLKVLAEHLFEDVTDPTLIAHWPLDEAQGDIAYNNVAESDGTLMGDPVWQPEAGMAAGALQFDGMDDRVITDSVLNPADGPFSVLAWVKGGAPSQAVISEPGGADWLSLDPLTGHLMTELTSAGRGANFLLSQTAIDDGNWHRIGLVWDGLHRMLYVDGVAVAQDTQDGLASPATGLYIGCGKSMQPGTHFSGLIDDVRIYNRAVSP